MNVVLCNCLSSESDALARALVSEGLAACVNILPAVRSVYLWEGELCEGSEDTLLIKTASHRVNELGDRIRSLHSYDTVEIVVLEVDVSRSDPRYVEWVRSAPPRGES